MKYLIVALIFTIFSFIAWQDFAGHKTSAKIASEIKQISANEAYEIVKDGSVQFIDVRTPEEYKNGHAPKAANMPLATFEKESAKLDKEKAIYLICQTGRRSQKAAEILKNAEFKEIYNVSGGTSAWILANLPLEK